MDHSLLLSVDVPDGLIWGGIPTVLATIAGGIRLLWGYWTKRQEAERAQVKAVLEAKDAEITRLQKELSKKSDAHAAKVEELMMLAMNKVEEWGEKNRELQKDFTEVAAEFTTLARKFGLEEE